MDDFSKEYITVRQAASLWGMDVSRIGKLLRAGRIEGATRLGGHWLIEKGAPRPKDGRTRTGREENADGFFRYPSFEFKDENSFFPPLTEEEKQIKKISEEYGLCHYKEAKALLNLCAGDIKTKYLHIYALYMGCMIDYATCDISGFFDKYNKLSIELKQNIQHKIEMQQCLYLIEASIGIEDYYSNKFEVMPTYDYHKSFIPRLYMLCAIPLSFASKGLKLSDLRTHEINCKLLEKTDNYIDLQSIHLYLGNAYAFLKMNEQCLYHYDKAVAIAYEQKSYFNLCQQLFYTRQLFTAVLDKYPKEFKDFIENLSIDLHARYVKFMDGIAMDSIYKMLSSSDYIYISYAVQGYTNKEIANILHISEISVAKKYCKIYDLLNIKSKNKLIELYYDSTNRVKLHR